VIELQRSVFVDTSAYFAIANSRDENHRTATRIWRTLIESERLTTTSNHIVAEFHALMVRTFGQQAALNAVDRLVLASAPILRVSEEVEQAAMSILRRYTDKAYSLVDAMSFVLMHDYHIPAVFTFDRHFVQHGFETLGVRQ
jgi:predicted nucleic acid-binding protein